MGATLGTLARPAAPAALAALAAAAALVGVRAATPGATEPASRLRVLRSDVTGVTLELATPADAVGLMSSPGGSVAVVRGEGYAAPDEGKLPERAALVAVPAGVRVTLDARVTAQARLWPGAGDHLAPGSVAESVKAVASSAAQITGEAWIRDLRVVRVVLRPVAVAAAGDALVLRGRIVARIGFEGEPQLSKPRPDPQWEAALARLVVNWPTAAPWRVPGGAGLDEVTPNPLAAEGAWKVEVAERGWQFIPASTLFLSGIPPGLDPRRVRLFDNNVEVPRYVVGGEDGRIDGTDRITFFGWPVDTRYAGTNVYWMTVDTDEPGTRIGVRSAKPGSGRRPNAFTDTLRLEQENLYDAWTPPEPGDDRFYWARLVTGGSVLSATHEITFPLPGLMPGPARLAARLKGADEAEHRVQLTLNGDLVADQMWSGTTAVTVEVSFDDSLRLDEDANTLQVQAFGAGPDSFFLDWVGLDYPHDFDARGGALEFTADLSAPHQIIGLPERDVVLADVTDPAAPVRLADAIVAGVGPYVARFAAQAGHRYLVAPSSAWLRPTVTVDMPNPTIVNSRSGADVIIVSHRDFLRSAAVLIRALRTQPPLRFRVQAVDVQDAYDAFSDGEPDPTAIRRMVENAYENWPPPAPSYLLLIGDGHWDYRHYVSDAPWFVPPLLSYLGPAVGEVPSDNAFVSVSGADIVPDLAVGRIPVRTVRAGNAAADRLRDYELAAAAPWWDRALMVADDGPAGAATSELFSALAREVELGLPSGLASQRITLGEGAYPNVGTARLGIRQALGNGVAIVGYVGEAARTQWSAEGLWRTADVDGLANDALPVVLELTARTGHFADPFNDALGELWVVREVGGALATWSSAGAHVGAGLELAGRSWAEAVYEDGYRGGAAAMVAKAALFGTSSDAAELIESLNWLGDPALVVAGSVPRDPPSPTPIVTPGTPTPSPSPSPTPTGTATPTATSTQTASPSPTGIASATPSPTAADSPGTPTASRTRPSASATATRPATSSPTASATGATAVTATASATPTAGRGTPSPTGWPSGTPATPTPTIRRLPGEGGTVYLPVAHNGGPARE